MVKLAHLAEHGPPPEAPEPPVQTPSGQGFRWPPPKLRDFIEEVKTRPDPEWIVPNLIPFDAAVLLSGAPKRAFKTWLAFWLAVGIASGKSEIPAFHPAVRLQILIVELEGPAKQLVNRWEWLMKSACAQDAQDSIFIIHRYPVLLDDPEWVTRLCEFVASHGIKFMVIDTLAKASTGDENSAASAGNVMRAVDRLRHAMSGGTVLYLHHLRKPGEDKNTDMDDDIRGSTALAGFYDVHIGIRQKTRDQDWLDLIVRQSNGAERYFKAWWTIDRDEGIAKPHIEEYDVENISEDVVAKCIAMLLPDMPYSMGKLQEAWQLPSEVVRAMAYKAVEDGLLEKAGKNFRLPVEV